MTKKRAALAVALVLALGFTAFGLNASANAAAREELDRACGCARQSVHATLTESTSIFFDLFGDDAGEMRSFMRSEVDLLCDELEAELTPMTWNAGRNFSPSSHPERSRRATAAVERARPRCPAIYGEALGGFGAEDGLAEELCDDLFDGLARNDQAEPESIPVWDWPAAIDRSMCLDAVRARARLADAP